MDAMQDDKEKISEVSHPSALIAKLQYAGRLLRFILSFPFLLIFVGLEKMISSTRSVVVPPVSGTYAVGRRCCHWIDSARREQFSSDLDDKRELLVWFWYPTNKKDGVSHSPYLPQPWATRLRQIGDARTTKIVCNAVDDAPVADGQTLFPLLVFAPGLQALPTDYTSLLEELASHGYVVAGICGPYTPPLVLFPNGKEILGNDLGQCGASDENEMIERKRNLLSVWREDMRFVIDKVYELKEVETAKTALDKEDDHQAIMRLCDTVDLGKIGALGHSFGGVTALQLCINDDRCKAAICMDGWFEQVDTDAARVVSTPFLYFSADLELGAGMLQVERRQSGHFANGWSLKAKGFVHNSFSDGPLTISAMTRKMAGLFLAITGALHNPFGTVPGGRTIEITRSSVRAFFDQYLKHQETFFEVGKSPYAEATLERLPE